MIIIRTMGFLLGLGLALTLLAAFLITWILSIFIPSLRWERNVKRVTKERLHLNQKSIRIASL
jgi:hypothetical protein